MRAAILDLLSFCIVLIGTMLFMEPEVFRHPHKLNIQQQSLSFSGASFVKDGEAGQTPYTLLLKNEVEHKLLEQNRPGLKFDGFAARAKSGLFISGLSLEESLLNENYLFFSSAIPIYLKVLSLRL